MLHSDIINFFNYLELNYKEEFDKIEISKDYDHYGMDFEFSILGVKVLIWFKYQNVYLDKLKGVSVYDNLINLSFELKDGSFVEHSIPTNLTEVINQFENLVDYLKVKM